MAPKKKEEPPPEPEEAEEQEEEEEKPEGEDENDVVNRDPVVFPSIEDRVSGASPIVLCLLDDPPNPSVEQIVVDFLRAFFMREVVVLAKPCMTAGIPPRAPKVKDLIFHMRKALGKGADAACVLGITQRALLDDIPGLESPFARVHGGAAIICTKPLGDRYDWSETFAFEKRFGRFSEQKCTKTKLCGPRVQSWQKEKDILTTGRPVESEDVPSQRRRFLRRVMTLALHTTGRLFGLHVAPYDPDMRLWISALADIKVFCGCEPNNLKTATRPLTLNNLLGRCDALVGVLQGVNEQTGSFRIGQRRFHEFDAEILWLQQAKGILEHFFVDAASRAKWPAASFDLPRLYGGRTAALRDSPAFAEVVLQGWQKAYHESTSFTKEPVRTWNNGRALTADLRDRFYAPGGSRTCLSDMQSVGGHHVELVTRTARQCFLAEPSPLYRTNDRMPHYYA